MSVFDEIAAGHGQPLAKLTRLFPSSRLGRPVSLGCILRWVQDGVKLPDGSTVRLEAARCAGRWLSTPAAIGRFLSAQTPRLDQAQSTPRTPAARTRAAEQASRELEAIGI